MFRKIAIIAFLLLPFIAMAQEKYAVVIGNANYKSVDDVLNNPLNDAIDMKTTLESLGFTVYHIPDGTLEQMQQAIINLKKKLSTFKNSYGIFYYSGHGVQSKGENYLIPVDAKIPSENMLPHVAVPLRFVLAELEDANNSFNLIILDACRNLPKGLIASASKGGSDRGLNRVSHAPNGSIIMYAASSGETAKDGTGRNGVFTGQLLKNLKIPGLLLDEVLDRTGADVLKVSSNTQRPEISKQHYGKVYLGSIPTPPTPRPTPVAPTPAPTPKPAIVKDIRKIEAVQIDGGTFTMGSPAEEIGRDNDETEHKVTVSAFKIGKYPVTQREWQEIMGNNPSQFKGDNLPVENVSWYDAVEYCNRRSIAEGLTPAYNIDKHREDVNNKNSPNNDNIKWTVSWDKSANGYRLPTEAEWEYAAKAGNSSPFNTGNNITTSQANYDGSYPYGANAKGQNRQMTTAVGSFEPNAWGLYDMHGNVWEWCWDWHAKYSSTAQTDPDGATVGAGRALRGGSWFSIGEDLRSAYRNNNAPTAKSAYRGFRVVRR